MCKLCPQALAHSDLIQHKHTHSYEKPYSVGCVPMTARNCNFMNHTSALTGEKIYKSPPPTFASNYHLGHHIQRHTDQKPVFQS
ncbi:unnamed protein product [Ixodes pacificus]